MMKKTTYFIIGLVLVIILTLTCLTLYKVRSLSLPEYKTSLCIIPLETKEMVETQEKIEEVEFSSKNHSLDKDYLFYTISVVLNDSIEHPYLTIDSIFRKYLDISVRDGRLKLDIIKDPASEPQNKIQEMINVSILYDNVIRLYLPRHPLTRVSSTFGRLEINGLDTKKLTMFSNDHLNLDNCHIDSLLLTAGGYAKMKFKDSTIDYMRLHMEDNFIKINCSDSTALIKKLDFIACEGIKTDVFLNQANIDTLRWDPPHPTQLTVRIKNPINIVK